MKKSLKISILLSVCYSCSSIAQEYNFTPPDDTIKLKPYQGKLVALENDGLFYYQGTSYNGILSANIDTQSYSLASSDYWSRSMEFGNKVRYGTRAQDIAINKENGYGCLIKGAGSNIRLYDIVNGEIEYSENTISLPGTHHASIAYSPNGEKVALVYDKGNYYNVKISYQLFDVDNLSPCPSVDDILNTSNPTYFVSDYKEPVSVDYELSNEGELIALIQTKDRTIRPFKYSIQLTVNDKGNNLVNTELSEENKKPNETFGQIELIAFDTGFVASYLNPARKTHLEDDGIYLSFWSLENGSINLIENNFIPTQPQFSCDGEQNPTEYLVTYDADTNKDGKFALVNLESSAIKYLHLYEFDATSGLQTNHQRIQAQINSDNYSCNARTPAYDVINHEHDYPLISVSENGKSYIFTQLSKNKGGYRGFDTENYKIR